MAQIINYLHTTQDTRFSDDDDYAHHYAGQDDAVPQNPYIL